MRIEIATKHFPRLTAWHVRKALKWIDRRDLAGLECVRLLDYEPQDSDISTQPPYLRGFLHVGHYFIKKGKRPATIALYTRDLYYGIPALLAASPMVTVELVSTLAHEVGHHVIASRSHIEEKIKKQRRPRAGLANSEAERVAEEYASSVIRTMLKHPYYRIGKLLSRILSRFYFERGLVAHGKRNFRSAASLHFRAYIINPENSDAGQAYLQDKRELLKTPSALSDAERLWIYHQRAGS
jgi:hypothetical protein